jgi:kumamolisin
MSHAAGFTAIAASQREPLADAKRVGPVDPDSPVEVTVVVRRRDEAATARRLAQLIATHPAQRQYATPAEIESQHGANPEELARVQAFAQAAGLQVRDSSVAHRTVALRGSAAAMSRAFDVQLAVYEHPRLGRFRGRIGTVAVPAELAQSVVAVLGLDNRPNAQPRARRGDRATALAVYTPPQVAAFYSFTPLLGPDGGASGQCIGLIELGGGYNEDDLTTYFQHKLGIKPVPRVVEISVDGATNKTDGGEGEREVVGDIEIAGSIANGATIAVYFAPNNGGVGFFDAINEALKRGGYEPPVLSISWGGPETDWPEQIRNAIDGAFANAVLLGVSIFTAASDFGAGDNVADGRAHADFPSSSPHVHGCGGTHLEVKGQTISLERVWNEWEKAEEKKGKAWASGGGVSECFPLPSWQQAAHVPPSINPEGGVGRGVPDVAGNADPNTGYLLYINGGEEVGGGTSAVAPLWGALAACLNERLGRRVGLLNPLLYSAPAPQWACHDITEGKNGFPVGTPGYNAGPGWDPCSGLGSPIGSGVLRAARIPFLLETPTPITEQDANENFAAYAIGPYSRDGRADLYCIKNKKTGSKSVEVHVLGNASDYQAFLLETGTPLTEADALATYIGYLVADYDNDGNPDLFCLKSRNTAGMLELHVLNGADGYRSYLAHLPTAIAQQDALLSYCAFALGDYNGDGHVDLYCLRVFSFFEHMEVHILSGASGYQSYLLKALTPIPTIEARKQYTAFLLSDYNGDGRLDLWALKSGATASGMLEVDVLDGSKSYGAYLLRTPTPISASEAAADFTGYGIGSYTKPGQLDLFCLKARDAATHRLELHVVNGARYFVP